jgi:hypothetical protein
MKRKSVACFCYLLPLTILICCGSSDACAQFKVGIGFAAGYATTAMGEVNSDLVDSYQMLTSAGAHPTTPNEAKGGISLEGNIFFKPGRFFVGPSVGYIASSGRIGYTDATASFEESYKMNTVDILLNIGTSVPLDSTVSILFTVGGGYGIAGANHIGRLVVYSSPQSNIDVANDLSGGYFSARIQSGLEFDFKAASISLGISYRISNAGALKGTAGINGLSYSDEGVKNARGGDISFDFSGFTFSIGVSFAL